MPVGVPATNRTRAEQAITTHSATRVFSIGTNRINLVNTFQIVQVHPYIDRKEKDLQSDFR